MPEWRSLTLGSVCDEAGGSVQTGPFGSQLHAHDYVPTGVPCVMPRDIGDNRIETMGLSYVDEADAERLSRHRLRVGDIVYSRRGDVERRALVRADNAGWLCGTGCLRIRVGDLSIHDPRFIAFALGLADSREWIRRHAVGATMLNLNTQILSDVPLRLPAVDGQRAIAEVLGALDDKIAANDRVIEASSRLMLSVLSTAAGTTRLDSIARLEKESVRPDEMDDAVAHFSLPAFDDASVPETALATTIKSNKFRVKDPCVLMAKLNPRIPRVWNLLSPPMRMAVASTEFMVLAPTEVSTSALWAALGQPAVSAELSGMVTGTSGSHQRVKPAEAMHLHVSDPRTLSSEALALVDGVGRVAAERREESQKLATTRDELLPLLMSGRVRVKDAESTVAGVT